MSKHAAHTFNRYLGNRAFQTGNTQESQPQQSSQEVRSTLLWPSENTVRIKIRVFRRSILHIYLKLRLPRVLDSLCPCVNIYV